VTKPPAKRRNVSIRLGNSRMPVRDCVLSVLSSPPTATVLLEMDISTNYEGARRAEQSVSCGLPTL